MNHIDRLKFKFSCFLYGFQSFANSFKDWLDLMNDTVDGVPFENTEEYKIGLFFTTLSLAMTKGFIILCLGALLNL